MLDAITVQSASESGNLQTLLYTILLAFMLSSIIGIVYQKTFSGSSYSRNYVQAIILISIIAAVIIQAIGDSLARGLGIMAAMAIIRFRTNLKDPRDLLFLFASLAAGISCGAYAFTIAVVGTLGFSIAAIILYYSPLGPQQEFNGVLRFSMPLHLKTDSQSKEKAYLDRFMQNYCNDFSLVTLKEIEEGERLAYSYQIKLRKDKEYEDFLTQLKRLPSLQGVNLKILDI